MSPEHTIVLNTEAKSGYGNQYVLIKHYDRFVFIESFLAQQGISLNVRDNFLLHLKPHNPHSEEVLIQNNVLTQINQYLNALNPFVQMFYMVISNLAKPQDPHMLNIKLPDKEDFSIKDMENLMKKLHIIFCGIADSIDIPASFDIVGALAWFRQLGLYTIIEDSGKGIGGVKAMDCRRDKLRVLTVVAPV